jgi:two-component sensor histidine kinase
VELGVSGGAAVTIDVRDDGPGYPAGPQGSGGLGLDLVGRLLAVCGGRLELTRLAPHGTRARVVLPPAAPPAPLGPASPSPARG